MVDVVYGDMSHPEDVQQVADRANAIGTFDAVVHNAGVMHGADVFAVNVVAPFLLTAWMNASVRAILLGSSMHRSGSSDLEGLDLFDASTRPRTYSDSKLFVAALAMALATRLPDTPVHTVDPGWVPTRMGGPSASDDLVQGHRTQEWLVTSDTREISPHTGGYWYHQRTVRPLDVAYDQAFQDRPVDVLERRTGVTAPRSGA